MLETLKRKRRISQRNKQSRKYQENELYKQSRIGHGIFKKYKYTRSKYTQRIRKHTLARYDDAGNLISIGGGIFDYFRLKYNVRKIKNIIGKLNVLERHIKKDLDSYEVQAKQFKTMADKSAQYQTEYIIAKRRNVILKNYRKDSEEINQKTDKNVIATIDAEIKRSDSDYKHSEKMVAAQYKEAGKDIKNFIYLSKKYQNELKKFDQIDELRKKVETYQLEISHIREKAQESEGRSDLGKAEKAVIVKYRANKADYDTVLRLTDQDLQTVRELQQRISNFTITMEYYKNQFGMYKAEGYESKGSQGSIKVGGKLKKWAELTDTLAASLMGVFENSKGIITTLEEIKTAITKCRTELVTVPEYHNKEANANAILWFEHDVEDMIKIVKELKKHFGDMKNEFYNQISAENMYSNYNYNSRFLRVIEIRLKFYGWMIDRAFTLEELGGEKRNLIRDIKEASGGYYNLIGGSRRPSRGRTTGRPSRGRTSSAPPPSRTPHFQECQELKDLTPMNEIEIIYLVKSLKTAPNTKGLIKTDEECYTTLNKEQFINVIKNKFARYLLAAYLEKDILDPATQLDDELKKGIKLFSNVIKLLQANTNWDDNAKRQIADKFKERIERIDIDNAITRCNSTKKIGELFAAATGNPKTGITPAPNTEESTFINYLGGKNYLKDFLKELLSHPTLFYGVLDYDTSKGNVINNYIASLPADTTSTAASSSTTSVTKQANTKNSKYTFNLNKKELEEIKGYTNSIRDGLGKLGIYPSADFETIADLLFEVENAIEDVYSALSVGDEKVDTPLKGLDNYKKFLSAIKKRVDINDVNVNIADDDYLNDMKYDLGNLKADYKTMKQLFDNVGHATKPSIARDALKELIKEYNNDDKGKESIGKIADRVLKNPTYSKKPAPGALSSSTTTPPPAGTSATATPTTTTTGTGASPVATSLNPATSVATNPIANTKAKELQNYLDTPPPWLADLDARSKQNKDYISNILIRIPNNYPKQYKEVKEQFTEIQKRVKELSDGPGNALAKLSDDFQTMTTTLIDIKTIEADLIDVKVKAEPRRALGLGNYIAEPLSLEKKSQAREDTKKINEMVKGMMQNTFFEDRGDKARQEDEASKIFERILPNLSKDHPPRITLEELNLLRKPDALSKFLEKLAKAFTNAGITGAASTGQSYDSMKEIKMKFCRLTKLLKDNMTDEIETQKINEVEAKLGNCFEILKHQGKDGKRDKGGRSQYQQGRPNQQGQTGP